MDITELSALIALTLGVGWASGINLYAAVLALGLAGATGYINLPAELDIIQHPMVIAAAGFMYCVEFFADKVPGVDSGWDAIHTFVRLPAGALLASGMMGEHGMALQLAAGLVGGTMATATHATKAGGRAIVNTSPEPFSNWTLSVVEDVSVFTGIWLMLTHPTVFLICLAIFIGLMIWLLPKIVRALKKLYRTIRGWFQRQNLDEDIDYSKPFDETSFHSTPTNSQSSNPLLSKSDSIDNPR